LLLAGFALGPGTARATISLGVSYLGPSSSNWWKPALVWSLQITLGVEDVQLYCTLLEPSSAS
jgi:hypothetical protein